MNRGAWPLYVATLLRLRSINGLAGGYYHDLTGRVYRKMSTPEEKPEILKEGPYVCLPVDVADSKEGTEQQATHRSIRINGWAFIPDPGGDPRDSIGTEGTLKMYDDLCRAFPGDNVGGVLCELLNCEPVCGVIGSGYGEVPFILEFAPRIISAQSLGPLA